MKNFKELIVWQKSIELVKKVYQLTKSFPAEEKFGVVSQLNRASVSIAANIAEGSSRDSDKDYLRFLQLSLGSAFEVQTYLVVASELNWAKKEILNETENLVEEVIRMIYSFMKKIRLNTNS